MELKKMGWANNIKKCPRGHTEITVIGGDVRLNYVSCHECQMVYYKKDFKGGVHGKNQNM